MSGEEYATLVQYRRLVAEVDDVKLKRSADGRRFMEFHRKDFAELAAEVGALRRIVAKLVETRDSDGQPDWMGNRDHAKARKMLGSTWAWVQDVGIPYGLEVEPCWPWHRGAVGVLLAARHHYYAALHGDREESVTDFMTRHLEAVQRRVKRLTPRCDGQVHYPSGDDDADGFAFDQDISDRIVQLAAWYAEGASDHPPGLRDRPVHDG